METQPSAQSSFQKLNVDNSCQKTRKIRCYIFEVLFKTNIFQNRMCHLVETLTLKLTCLIMQQKQISKIFRILILQVLHKNQI